jgi:uncharacterized phage protein (TIGR02220 family)
MLADIPPEPLVAADVDLRDFQFLPLDVVRLRDSGLTAKATGDEFRAAVLLWCASWHQIPAASLPDDDQELANLCGYSRAMREWAKVKAGALRGWIKCSDGRLYHPIVAEKAVDAWLKKQAQRARTEAARRAREEERQRKLQGKLQPLLQAPQISVTEIVTESKGQGQGQGQGQGLEKIEDLRSLSGKPDDPALVEQKAARRKRLNADAVVVLDFLNRATGSRFQPVEANLGMIRARLAEADVSTCKRVIAGRWEAWANDPKMSEYLRPATLFAARNFANYAGQLPAIEPEFAVETPEHLEDIPL